MMWIQKLMSNPTLVEKEKDGNSIRRINKKSTKIKNDDSADFRPYARDTDWLSEIIISIKTFACWFVKGYKLNLKPQPTQK